jgi:hypothetical protein
VQLRLVSPQRGDNRFPVDAAGLARYCPSLIVVRLFVTRGLDPRVHRLRTKSRQ